MGKSKNLLENEREQIVRLRKQSKTFTEIANIVNRTVRRRLEDFNLRGRKPQKKPLLSSRNRKRRLAFAKAHKHWTSEDWQKVLFSDESKFNRVCSDGIRYVRRRIGESLKTQCVLKTLKHGGGNVMVWACFSRSGPGPICRINGIMDRFQYKDILKNTMLPFARNNMSDDFIFQNDNDPKHTARVVKQFFQEENITVLPWPSQSPDINPIENLWSIIKKTVQGYKPKHLNELYSTIETAWSNITVDQCKKLIDSMPRRCTEVIRNNGYWTKY
ncbi:Transposable element Tcb2 transposase [Anthophora retusa]